MPSARGVTFAATNEDLGGSEMQTARRRGSGIARGPSGPGHRTAVCQLQRGVGRSRAIHEECNCPRSPQLLATTTIDDRDAQVPVGRGRPKAGSSDADRARQVPIRAMSHAALATGGERSECDSLAWARPARSAARAARHAGHRRSHLGRSRTRTGSSAPISSRAWAMLLPRC